MGDPFPQNCLFSWGIWTPSHSRFLGQFQDHIPNVMTIGSVIFAHMTAECLFYYGCPFPHRWLQSVPMLYNGTPLSPFRITPSHGGSEPPSNTWFPGPTWVLNPNGISIASADFAGLTSVTDQQTDRQIDQPCYSVSNNRPHLRT